MSILNDDMSNIQKDFIKSNDKFIMDLAKLKQKDVLLSGDRDKYIQEEITDKVKLAKRLGLDEFDKDYYNNQIEGMKREVEEEKNPLLGTRQIKAEGGSLLADDMSMMQEEEQEMPTHTMPDGTVMPGATHEEGEMMMEESEMEPDSEMEDNYLDFIINEALSEEEEDMLMSKLEQDEELSMLFDKVIEVASEFAGSGPVEGPGTGVSDSIPARLSDGEFVFTAKAVEEIGADNLMAMMKEAEMKADERQGMANGGTMEEEDQPKPVTMVAEQAPIQQDIRVTKQTVGSQAAMQEEQDLIGEEIKKGMLSSRPYVRS